MESIQSNKSTIDQFLELLHIDEGIELFEKNLDQVNHSIIIECLFKKWKKSGANFMNILYEKTNGGLLYKKIVELLINNFYLKNNTQKNKIDGLEVMNCNQEKQINKLQKINCDQKEKIDGLEKIKKINYNLGIANKMRSETIEKLTRDNKELNLSSNKRLIKISSLNCELTLKEERIERMQKQIENQEATIKNQFNVIEKLESTNISLEIEKDQYLCMSETLQVLLQQEKLAHEHSITHPVKN